VVPREVDTRAWRGGDDWANRTTSQRTGSILRRGLVEETG
jgi:hypothetical protein